MGAAVRDAGAARLQRGSVGPTVLSGHAADPAPLLRLGRRRLSVPGPDGSPALRADRVLPAGHQPRLPRGVRAVPFGAPGGEVEARGLSQRARARLRLGGARVLLYHAVDERGGGDPRYAVTRTQLAGHLDQIRRGGYSAVAVTRVWSGLDGEAAPAVALTFDDGRASDYRHAYPLLMEHGLVGEVFVNSGTIGREGYLSWGQAREMSRDRKSTRLNSSHSQISYAVFCLKK